MKLARFCRRDFSEFLEPERCEPGFRRDLPVAGGEARLRNRIARQRPDEADALLDAAILMGEARRRNLQRGASGARIDEEPRAGTFRERQHGFEGRRLVSVLAPDGEQ